MDAAGTLAFNPALRAAQSNPGQASVERHGARVQTEATPVYALFRSRRFTIGTGAARIHKMIRMLAVRTLVPVAAVVVAAIHPLAQGGTAPSDRSVFRSGIELVTLHVTVTDAKSKYVTDLDPGEFRVFEDGRPQQLKFFQRTGLPLAVTLLLDASSSVRHVLPELQHAAVRFIRELDAQDVASVVTFTDGVRVLQDFTPDRAALERAVQSVTDDGMTALYNGVYIALKELAKIAPDPHTNVPRRRTLVVLSDGDDTASLVAFEDVLELAARTDAVIYAIRLERLYSLRQDLGPGRFILSRLAEQTGGRAFFPQHGYALRSVLQAIRSDLTSQYALAYLSDDLRTDGEFRKLSVQVERAGVVARTRRGYFARLR
jgi:Ca-activated chloride channel homolog